MTVTRHSIYESTGVLELSDSAGYVALDIPWKTEGILLFEACVKYPPGGKEKYQQIQYKLTSPLIAVTDLLELLQVTDVANDMSLRNVIFSDVQALGIYSVGIVPIADAGGSNRLAVKYDNPSTRRFSDFKCYAIRASGTGDTGNITYEEIQQAYLDGVRDGKIPEPTRDTPVVYLTLEFQE